METGSVSRTYTSSLVKLYSDNSYMSMFQYPHTLLGVGDYCT